MVSLRLRTACSVLSALALATAAEPVAAQSRGNFAAAAAASGREVFLGQPANTYAPGMVYVYRPDAKGAWREAARLTAADSALDDGFGQSLAADDGTLLVGAGSSEAPGAVYVFEREKAGAGAWRQRARLTGQAGQAGDGFGVAIALSGDVAFVGAPGVDSARGAVHVLRRAGGKWTEAAVLRPDGLEPRALFGAAVSVEGDLLVVGAAGADSGAGAVFIYRRDAAGAWQDEAKLASGGRGSARNARLGYAVLARGGRAFVGAPGMTSAEGAVLVFERDSAEGRWLPAHVLMPFESGPAAQFGVSIARIGGELWVGAPGAAGSEGRVYRFLPDSAGQWTTATKLQPDSTGTRMGFGLTLAAAEGVAVVGMPVRDFGEGRAALFTAARRGEWRLAQSVMGDIFTPPAVAGRPVDCTSGKVGMFACQGVDLLAYMPVAQLGGARGVELNDIWGWTDPETGREYALVGRQDGMSFVDVTDPARPRLVGNLPKTETSPTSTWRDVKVYKNHAYIVADGARAHGMQVFDLTRLRAVKGAPVTFTPDVHYDRVNSAHNIVSDTATGFMYIVGASSGGETCGGGLHMVDVRDPKRPTFAGCFADAQTGRAGTGYSHDAQCVVYRGPDTRYTGREICFGANETALSIADVTDKANPIAITRASYPNVGYGHQGWLDEQQRYYYMNDELDELQGKAERTRTIIWDVSKLDEPVIAGEYLAPVAATDHNLYIKGDLMFQSNYVSGLRVIDISNRTQPREVGYFDSVPLGENTPGFDGSWSNYPYFKSGTIVFTSGREGLFIVRANVGPMVP